MEDKSIFQIIDEIEKLINLLNDKQKDSPYLTKVEMSKAFNPNYNINKLCKCGHHYYRHFDSYPDIMGNTNRPVGCKYCDCFNFEEKK